MQVQQSTEPPSQLLVLMLCAMPGVAACSDYNIHGKGDGGGRAGEAHAPDIELDRERVDFGVARLPDDAALSETVLIRNVGDARLDINSLRIADATAPFTITALSSERIPAGGTTELVVDYVARDAGEASTTLWINSTDPDEAEVGVALLAAAEQGGGGTDTADLGTDECECPEGFEAREDGSECFREYTELASPMGGLFEVCPVIGYSSYGKFGAQYPNGARLRDSYWGEDTGAITGRLNAVGVWECTTSGQPTDGSNPINMWIGFQVCIDLDDPGAYILGLAGDNRIRLTVDGVIVHSQMDDQTANFNYWWLSEIELTAGTHIVQVEGYNSGGIGAFGAELSGPFPTGSIATDEAMMAADYEGSVVWNTAAAIGDAFRIGGGTQWICPDGTSFDMCTEQPECEVVETTACDS